MAHRCVFQACAKPVALLSRTTTRPSRPISTRTPSIPTPNPRTCCPAAPTRSFSSSAHRSWQQPLEPEYDYDPALDHRFLPRLAREIKHLCRQSWHNARYRSKKTETEPPPKREPRTKIGKTLAALRAKHRRAILLAAAAAALVFWWWHLEEVPVTGRRRFMLRHADGDPLLRLGLDAREQQRLNVMLAHRGERLLPASDPRAERVRRVLARCLRASGMDDRPWEAHVVESPKTCPNAFVLPGDAGRVFVYDDLLRWMDTDDQLAGVLCHELAHKRAEHGRESLVRFGALLPVLYLATRYVRRGRPWLRFVLRLVAGAAAGVASVPLVLLPFRRLAEYEADAIGLVTMAEAGYDPRGAVRFFEQMGGARPYPVPDWLTTHPSDKKRVKRMMKRMPEAMEKWEQSGRRQAEVVEGTALEEKDTHIDRQALAELAAVGVNVESSSSAARPSNDGREP